MTENIKEYNAFLKRVHEKVLKPMGFRRYGGNFRRFTKSAIFTTGQLVSFERQKSGDGIAFRVMLGKKSSFNGEPTPSFKLSDCAIPETVCLTELSDQGFKRFVICGADDAAVEDEICGLLSDQAMAWFGLI